MRRVRFWSRLLLYVHLFVCLLWLYLFRSDGKVPEWMIHVFLWSILGVQFTWGLTVGLIFGPSRKRRQCLWFSLLTVFMPLYLIGPLLRIIQHFLGFGHAAVWLAIFAAILACETFGGVMLGAKLHGDASRNWDDLG
jgi:hypothetical protein